MRLLALILSTAMISLTSGVTLAAEGQAVCIGCMALPKDPVVTAAQTTRNTVLNPMAAQILYNRMKYLGIERACGNFAGPHGYGVIGKYIMKNLNEEQHPTMLAGTSDLKQYCPAFDTFSEEDKKSFYVYLFTHFAFAESSCKPDALAPGLQEGDWAAGLYQLHKYREDYYTRTERYRNKCKKGDSANGQNSTRCAMGMIEGQMSSKDALIFRGAHFEPFTGTSSRVLIMKILQPNGSRKEVQVPLKTFIKTSIQKYPLCK